MCTCIIMYNVPVFMHEPIELLPGGVWKRDWDALVENPSSEHVEITIGDKVGPLAFAAR